MSRQSRYRKIAVAGAPYEMGRQIGEAAGDEIRGFCDIALERVNKTVKISAAKAAAVAEHCIEDARRYGSHMVEEMQGMADAAGVSLNQLMLLQVRNQLKPENQAGCTSVAISAARGPQGPIVAQNWDNDPVLDQFTIVLTRRPTGKPALMNVTQAGLIAYIGFNDQGVGACLNSLPAPSREEGVPHYFTLRGVYEEASLDQAAHAVRRARRAIPANIILSTPQGPADLEVTIDALRVLHASPAGTIAHTNHFLHPELEQINDEFPELIQSKRRKERMDRLVDQWPEGVSIEDVKTLLRDHDGKPRSICRHANDDPDVGFWETVFSVIIEPAARRMHISRGTPCEHPYEIYQMD